MGLLQASPLPLSYTDTCPVLFSVPVSVFLGKEKSKLPEKVNILGEQIRDTRSVC